MSSPYTCGNPVLKKNKVNVGVYGLAVLPIDYLSRLECPFEQLCTDKKIDPDYREVFTAGIKAYQLVTYLKLVREHYGRVLARRFFRGACSAHRRLLQQHRHLGIGRSSCSCGQ